MSYVIVRELLTLYPSGAVVPCGEARFGDAVADVFERGELTITSSRDDEEWRVYRPGRWAEAIVVNSQTDDVEYVLTPSGVARERMTA